MIICFTLSTTANERKDPLAAFMQLQKRIVAVLVVFVRLESLTEQTTHSKKK